MIGVSEISRVDGQALDYPKYLMMNGRYDERFAQTSSPNESRRYRFCGRNQIALWDKPWIITSYRLVRSGMDRYSRWALRLCR